MIKAGIKLLLLFLMSISIANAAALSDVKKLSVAKAAVVVYAQNGVAQKYLRTAMSRIEAILGDNGIQVLDQEKAEELKNVWKQLEDPGYFVTAEDMVEKSQKYAIDGVLRVYLNASAVDSISKYFTATAQTDIRFVDNQANVVSFSTRAMGSPGNPPSDGLTESAALVNAVQRSIDEAAKKMGYEVIDAASPRLLKYTLDGPYEIVSVDYDLLKRNEFSNGEARNYAQLQQSDWIAETITCDSVDPGKSFAAIGGYVVKKAFGNMQYWSTLHLIDLKQKKEILSFGPLAKEQSQRGTSKIVDCMFIYNWRFLAALTEYNLYIWDTERNVLMTAAKLPAQYAEASLNYFNQDQEDYVVIMTQNKNSLAYRIDREK